MIVIIRKKNYNFIFQQIYNNYKNNFDKMIIEENKKLLLPK